MLTLALDAATYEGSVALVRDGEVLAERTVAMRGAHEERLMPAVADALRDAGLDVGELACVACGAGPGSFTSLRIAASIAKGIAVARRIPLIVAPYPLLVVAGAQPPLGAGRYCALLDAMRGDVYGLDTEIGPQGAIVVRGEHWLRSRLGAEAHAASLGARLVGPGESPALPPHARGFAALIAGGLVREVEIADWEPDYGRKAEAQVRWEEAHGRPLEAR